jgi:hypothetical protein
MLIGVPREIKDHESSRRRSVWKRPLHLICINPQTPQPPHSRVIPFLDESDDHGA